MTYSATRPAPSGRASGDRANLYDEITDRIIAELEAGRLPWVQPWGTSGVAAPLANVPKDYEARLVKMDFNWAAENRERILAEWNKRYNAKSEPKK